jgi:2-polyprenyl-3-methyl-5-hydroxy-6-metoxy-1,4-benzoquinol methylase
MYTVEACSARWRRVLAPRSGDVRQELAMELSEYLHLSRDDVLGRFDDAPARFTQEWQNRVRDPLDERDLIKFYNESTTEIFDLAQWHADDHIHYRTLVCADIASRKAGRSLLDFGCGIGSDALVFADAGFEVTLADVSDPLLRFARWRCERRGLTVKTIDLKEEELPKRRYDVAICFDVLEHILRPLRAVDGIGRALRLGGLLFVHAPYGEDPVRPMHVVHKDIVTPRMRSVGFNSREDLDRTFPAWLWAPKSWEAFDPSTVERLGYAVHDAWLPGAVTARLASWYRRLIPARTT